jgi:hypothetical protein
VAPLTMLLSMSPLLEVVLLDDQPLKL